MGNKPVNAEYEPLPLKVVVGACKKQICSNNKNCAFTTWPHLQYGLCFDPNTQQACLAFDVYKGTCVVPQSFVHVQDLHDADAALIHQIFKLSKINEKIHQSLLNTLKTLKANSQINPFG